MHQICTECRFCCVCFILFIVLWKQNLNFKHCVNWLLLSLEGTNQRAVLMNGLEKDSKKMSWCSWEAHLICPVRYGDAKYLENKKNRSVLLLFLFYNDNQLVRDLGSTVSTLSALEAKVLLWVFFFFFWSPWRVDLRCLSRLSVSPVQPIGQSRVTSSRLSALKAMSKIFKNHLCQKKKKKKRWEWAKSQILTSRHLALFELPSSPTRCLDSLLSQHGSKRRFNSSL